MKILISACLLGVECRYDGGGNLLKQHQQLMAEHQLIPICPEVFGGLATPREPAERCQDKVITISGADVTAQFTKGAKQVLDLAMRYNCKFAVLKSNSPSCGHTKIYDGSFKKVLTDGSGILAELLIAHEIAVINEHQVDKLL